ncbi:MAG: purU [Glaciihabitans sp.]|nr:purU [Glaciihabitans sp.]
MTIAAPNIPPRSTLHAPADGFVLTLSCPERSGIVHAMTSFLLEGDYTIIEHHQFDDVHRKTLFLRTVFTGTRPETVAALSARFQEVAGRFDMTFELTDRSIPRVMVMVSKAGHCLNDLIFRWRSGTLGGEIAIVVSNHETLRAMAEDAGLPFLHIPVLADNKAESERRLLEAITDNDVDLVVLARYMQVLSTGLCERLAGRAINIHHSFLPGFKGARPYEQAYNRGVKFVGATAHYVTSDLDEGPIIEQEVIRVNHAYGPSELATIGRDAEALALSRAVRWHCERRVMVNHGSTVAFV